MRSSLHITAAIFWLALAIFMCFAPPMPWWYTPLLIGVIAMDHLGDAIR